MVKNHNTRPFHQETLSFNTKCSKLSACKYTDDALLLGRSNTTYNYISIVRNIYIIFYSCVFDISCIYTSFHIYLLLILGVVLLRGESCLIPLWLQSFRYVT